MPSSSDAARGLPCWLALYTTEVRRAAQFYSHVFEWDIDFESRYASHHAALCCRDDVPVASIKNPLKTDIINEWNVFMCSEDFEGDIRRAEQAGATVISPPKVAERVGEYAVLRGPVGEHIGLWHDFPDAEVSHVKPPHWYELVTNQPERARTFYETVFGLTFQTEAMGGSAYAVAERDGSPAFGLWPLPEFHPLTSQGVHSSNGYWVAYITVKDPDAAAIRAVEAGGAVLERPQDSDFCRWGVLQGPGGEIVAMLGEVEERLLPEVEEYIAVVPN